MTTRELNIKRIRKRTFQNRGVLFAVIPDKLAGRPPHGFSLSKKFFEKFFENLQPAGFLNRFMGANGQKCLKTSMKGQGTKMKKTLIIKILSGAVLTALCIAGTVNVAATDAVICFAAENDAYVAGADAKALAVNNDALTAAKKEKSAGENGTEGTDVVLAADEAAKDETAEGEVSEDGAAGKSETAAAAVSETAGTEGTAQTAQNSQTAPSDKTAQTVQTAQTTRNAQTEPGTQTEPGAQVSRPDQGTQTSQSNQGTQTRQTNQGTQTTQPTLAPTPDPTPAPTPTYPTTYTCSVCGTKYYDLNEAQTHMATHTAPEPEPTPAPTPEPTPEPTYVIRGVWQCQCGYRAYSEDELCDHFEPYWDPSDPSFYEHGAYKYYTEQIPA